MASDMTKWSTEIAEVLPGDVNLRGHRLSNLVGRVSYTDAAFLVVIGRLPTDAERKTLDAVLVSLVDHGISPTSVLARTLASCGSPMQASLAGGLLSIADWHGGAGEQVADYLVELTSSADPAATTKFASDALSAGRLIEGFGHPQHRDGDPRALLLLRLAEQYGTSGSHCQTLMDLDHAISSLRGPLGINVNGALAAVLLDLGFPAAATRGIVMAARSFGLIAHILEELDQGGRWRHVPATAVTYTGPSGQ